MPSPIEEKFTELIVSLTRKNDLNRWPDSVFFFQGDKCLFDYDLNSGRLWCDYEKVWKVLECGGRYNYSEVQSFIKKQVEQHFKLMVVTPSA